MADPYLGQIILVAFNYPPAGWAFCQGQLLGIADYDALFNLIGTTYGGDGQTTFGVPDLRGRIPLGAGQAPGLQNYFLGETGGAETTTLTVQQLGAHTHAGSSADFTATVRCKVGAGNQRMPGGHVHAVEASGATLPYSSAAPNAAMSANAVGVSGAVTAGAAGGGQPHDNVQPFLTLNFCISLVGVFPSQG
jgi:microcystin-dependent protein